MMPRLSKAKIEMKKNREKLKQKSMSDIVDKAIYERGKELRKEFEHTASTLKPQLHLIPYAALVGLANRFQLGQEKYGSRAWNALSSQVGLEDKEWLKERISHIIDHAYLYLQKLEGIIPDDGDDDASAIMWGGACLFEAKRIGERKK